MFTTFALTMLLACSDQSSRSPATTGEETWLRFGRDVVTSCRSRDVSRLVQELSVSPEDAQDLYNRIRAANPSRDIPQFKVTEELRQGLAAKTRAVVETFLRSYEDLCKYEPATLSVRTKKELGVESHGLIIWVRTEAELSGILVKDVILTPKGPRANDWLGPSGDPSKSEDAMWKKRARLQCNSVEQCTYPEWITFEYEYRS
jgi:hypothetical protein